MRTWFSTRDSTVDARKPAAGTVYQERFFKLIVFILAFIALGFANFIILNRTSEWKGKTTYSLSPNSSPTSEVGIKSEYSIYSDSSLPSEQVLEPDDEIRNKPESVSKLIEAIKEATRAAAGAGGVSEQTDDVFTEEDRQGWERANPCQSRLGLKSMYSRRDGSNGLPENLLWDEVLQEYTKLHRVCRKKVGNLKDYFLTGNATVPGCKFAIADFMQYSGLGNKVLAITNTVLYSIFTQRVVLVLPRSQIPSVMCEPFPGSSWVLDSDDFPHHWIEGFQNRWKTHQEVYEDIDNYYKQNPMSPNGNERVNSSERRSPDYKVNVHAVAMTRWDQPDNRFFCDAEQVGLSGAVWQFFTGCIYVIPKFFTVPSFRVQLEALFPDRLVLTRMLRSIMLPGDRVWEQVVKCKFTRVNETDRLVGAQIRFRNKEEEYGRMNDVINARFLKCAVETGALPPVELATGSVEAGSNNSRESAPSLEGSSRPPVKLFVASLFTGLSDKITQTYPSSGDQSTSTGGAVNVVQLTHDGSQVYGLESDLKALTEIILLSFSDELFVTPLSTFGGLAYAYGGLVPWILDFRPGDEHGPCQRGQTVDVCQQETGSTYSCPLDPTVDGKSIFEAVPFVQTCLAIDVQPYGNPGIQLLTSNASLSSK